MKYRKTLDKETQWQIGEAHYGEFLDYLADRYDIDRKVRTPRTNTLEEFFGAKRHEELVPMMMREFLSNTEVSHGVRHERN